MLWGRFPTHDGYQPEMPSKQLLRTVCEPFFEQMLVAVQQAVQAQNQQTSNNPGSFQDQVPCAGLCQPNREPSPEERSSIVHDSVFDKIPPPQEDGAFSRLFAFGSSSSNTEEESPRSGHWLTGSWTDAQTKASVESTAVQGSDDAESQYQDLVVEPPQRSDKQKTVTVCRHWKSKGYCRMQDQCKFLHPEHKCGVGLPGRGVGGEHTPNVGNLSDELALAAIDVKKKRAKNRKSKGKADMPTENMSVAEKLLEMPSIQQ